MPTRTGETQIVELALAGGRRIRARRRDGSGTPLVFLHGLLDSSEGWSEIAAASSRPSVAFDLPGFGGSDLPTRSRVSAYAEDIVAAMGLLDLDEVTLVGHSFGGAVAAAVAERIPERIASLLLLAPAGFGRIPLAEAVSIPGVRGAVATVLPFWLNAPMVLGAAYRVFVTAGEPVPSDVVARVRRDAKGLVPAAVAATEAVVAAGLSRRAFHRRRLPYHGPVAALWGDLDHVVPPRHAAGVKRAFPQAEVTEWDGMGHHPQRERSAELCSLIEAACCAPYTRGEQVAIAPARAAGRRATAVALPAVA